MNNELNGFHNTKESIMVIYKIQEKQFNVLKEEAKSYKRVESHKRKIEKAIDQQRASFRQRLKDVRKRKELHQSSPEEVLIESNKQSLTTEDGYTYEKTTRSSIEITTGTPTIEITIHVKKDDGA